MRIIYLVPDNQKPSWGVGVIYQHVFELKQAGYDAWIMHQQKGFRLKWLSLDVPILYLSSKKDPFIVTDTLVLPEVMMNFPGLEKIDCRKIIFIQNVFYLFEMMPPARSHVQLGISHALYIMPHMVPVIAERTGLQATCVPPFIADYFFKVMEKLHEREKTIVIYPKNNSLDYGILRRFIHDLSKSLNAGTMLGRLLAPKEQWRVVELKDKSHEACADILQKATFFICLNTTEAFNTSVPEAMAAGCINFCYEAFGPADFLRDGENVFVFPNNHIYPLLQKLQWAIENAGSLQDDFNRMRGNARATANNYKKENLRGPLLEFFQHTAVTA